MSSKPFRSFADLPSHAKASPGQTRLAALGAAVDAVNELHRLASEAVNTILALQFNCYCFDGAPHARAALEKLEGVIQELPDLPLADDPFRGPAPVEIAGVIGTSAHAAIFGLARHVWDAAQISGLENTQASEHKDEKGQRFVRFTSENVRTAPTAVPWDEATWPAIRERLGTTPDLPKDAIESQLAFERHEAMERIERRYAAHLQDGKWEFDPTRWPTIALDRQAATLRGLHEGLQAIAVAADRSALVAANAAFSELAKALPAGPWDEARRQLAEPALAWLSHVGQATETNRSIVWEAAEAAIRIQRHTTRVGQPHLYHDPKGCPPGMNAEANAAWQAQHEVILDAYRHEQRLLNLAMDLGAAVGKPPAPPNEVHEVGAHLSSLREATRNAAAATKDALQAAKLVYAEVTCRKKKSNTLDGAIHLLTAGLTRAKESFFANGTGEGRGFVAFRDCRPRELFKCAAAKANRSEVFGRPCESAAHLAYELAFSVYAGLCHGLELDDPTEGFPFITLSAEAFCKVKCFFAAAGIGIGTPPQIEQMTKIIDHELTLANERIGALAEKLESERRTTGQALPAADGQDAKGGPWSEPKGPTAWGRVFQVSAATFKKYVAEGKIRAEKLSDRLYRVHVDDLPKSQPKLH